MRKHQEIQNHSINQSSNDYNYLQPSFTKYIKETDSWLRVNRNFINGAIQYTNNANILREKIASKKVTVPSMIVISEDDSVIDAHRIKLFYEYKFTNTDNILIWYGSKFDTEKSASTFINPMRIDNDRISTGSQMRQLPVKQEHQYGFLLGVIQKKTRYLHDQHGIHTLLNW